MLRKSLQEYLEGDGLASNMLNQEHFVDLNFVDYMEAADRKKTIKEVFAVMYPESTNGIEDSDKFLKLSIRQVISALSAILRVDARNESVRKLVLEIMVSSMFSFLPTDIAYHKLVIERLQDLGAIAGFSENDKDDGFFCEESGEVAENPEEIWDDVPFR